MRLLFFGLLILLLVLSYAQAASLECFTNKDQSYKFNIGGQKSGSYRMKIAHKTGKLKGLTYTFMIRDVASPKQYDDYLIKHYTNGMPHNITYAMSCKPLQ